MDRKLRPANPGSAGPRPWIRAAGLALAVAGAGIALGTTLPSPAIAQVSGTSMSVPLDPSAPERYVVKKGDTLWDIADVFLRDPWYWPEIWYVNPEIANPHLIYPGDELYLTYVDGRPRVTMQPSSAMRLSPEVRTEPLSGAIRAIPYDVLMDFVGRPSLLERREIRGVPHVVGMRDRHIVGSEHNEIYGRGMGQPAPGSRYNVINVGQELVDPDDGNVLGFMAHFAGTTEVIQSTGAVVPGSESIFKMRREEDLAHLRVLDTNREILQGDRLFPAEVDVGDDFVISPPGNPEVLGQIIAIVDGVHVAGRYQVVAVNRGKRHGLAPGNALGIFYRGEVVRDRFERVSWSWVGSSRETVRLPDERSATMVLFRVYDRMSYGLIVESTQAIRRGDFVAHPQYGHRDIGTRDFMR